MQTGVEKMSITPCRAKWAGTMTDRERFNNQMQSLYYLDLKEEMFGM